MKNKEGQRTAPAGSRLYWYLLIAALLFFSVIRMRLLDFPLERDEGEYAYMAQLMLDGIPPYKEAYNMKLPGTYFTYAFFMLLFGQTVQAIHLSLLFFNLATVVFVFLLVRKAINDFTAFTAAFLYGLMSLGSGVLGFAAHATHYVILPAVAGVYLLLLALEKQNRRYYACSGLLLGSAFIMKQPGLLFIGCGGVYYVFLLISEKLVTRKHVINFMVFCLSCIAPFLAVLGMVSVWGVFEKFWFWTFIYSSKYAAMVPASEISGLFRLMFASVTQHYSHFWWLAGAGIVFQFFSGLTRKQLVFLNAFFVFSILSVCPGFYFRNHYFILALPAVALMAALGLNFVRQYLVKHKLEKISVLVPIAAILLLGGKTIAAERQFFFDKPVKKLSKMKYGNNPFAESIDIAEFVEKNTQPDDRIAILGSEPQIFFYSRRKSATGFIYTYSTVEDHPENLTMQKDMIAEIEASEPRMIIVINIHLSWLIHPGVPMHVFGWMDEYLKNYQMIGFVDLVNNSQTNYRYFDELASYQPASKNNIHIYTRK